MRGMMNEVKIIKSSKLQVLSNPSTNRNLQQDSVRHLHSPIERALILHSKRPNSLSLELPLQIHV
jgi:hypothetical protein